MQSEDVYLHGFGQRVERNEEHLHDPLLADRKGNTQVTERVKGHGHLFTHGADQRGFKKPVKRVHDHGVISSPMVTPCLICHFLYRAA